VEEGANIQLQRLEEEIVRETEVVADLQQRARTLEIEVAAWPPPKSDPRLVVMRQRRDRIEMVLGMASGTALAGLGWTILTHLLRGHG
jgi:hypothetical protein